MNDIFSFRIIVKTIVFLCFAFAFIQQTSAQKSPVITAANFSLKKGDVFVFHYCKTNNYDTGVAGKKKVWNFTHLKDSVTASTHKKVIDTQKCILPSQTPYASSFPNATIAVTHTIVPQFHYDYYSSKSYYEYWGYVLGFYYSIYSKGAALTPKYPFMYGDRFYSTSSFTDQSGIQYTAKDTLVVTGYGTLKLPYITIDSVLKIKQVHVYTSSVKTKTRLESYVYITPNYHAGLLNLAHAVTTSTINGAVIADSSDIWYASNVDSTIFGKPQFSNVAIDNLPKTPTHSIFSISPNPATNNLQIQGLPSNQKIKLTVVDVAGNVAISQQLTANSSPFYNLNIAALKQGNYLLKIEMNDDVVTKQFVKE
ncbi:MAG: T9SS type A sorting domain-containing protein [Parafilimonas sp.]|nr:T9SS type A sorting domain-containing protein [Parafilimonas sp.]